jgi:hypothetical protein
MIESVIYQHPGYSRTSFQGGILSGILNGMGIGLSVIPYFFNNFVLFFHEGLTNLNGEFIKW